MNENFDVAGALDRVLDKGREIAEQRLDHPELMRETTEWTDQYEQIMTNSDTELVGRELTSLWNVVSPKIDQWERGNYQC